MPLRMMNYRLLTRGRLRLVLKGIESQLCLRSDGMTEPYPVSKNMTIEHILPVEWKKSAWPLPEDIDEEEAVYQRNILKHYWESHTGYQQTQLFNVQQQSLGT